MAKMTKKQTRELEAAQAAWDAAREAIFAAAHPRTDVPFMACYAAAPMEARMAYDRARDELRAMERALIAAGRGWSDAMREFVADA